MVFSLLDRRFGATVLSYSPSAKTGRHALGVRERERIDLGLEAHAGKRSTAYQRQRSGHSYI
jgi:hypothetical protein